MPQYTHTLEGVNAIMAFAATGKNFDIIDALQAEGKLESMVPVLTGPARVRGYSTYFQEGSSLARVILVNHDVSAIPEWPADRNLTEITVLTDERTDTEEVKNRFFRHWGTIGDFHSMEGVDIIGETMKDYMEHFVIEMQYWQMFQAMKNGGESLPNKESSDGVLQMYCAFPYGVDGDVLQGQHRVWEFDRFKYPVNGHDSVAGLVYISGPHYCGIHGMALYTQRNEGDLNGLERAVSGIVFDPMFMGLISIEGVTPELVEKYPQFCSIEMDYFSHCQYHTINDFSREEIMTGSIKDAKHIDEVADLGEAIYKAATTNLFKKEPTSLPSGAAPQS